MPSTSWARIVIALAAAITAGVMILMGDKVNSDFVKSVSVASSAVILFLLAFERWLWRLPGVNHLAQRPVLNGTWRTELRTTYKDRGDETIEAYLVVDQTYSRICVRMLFDRSQSVSMSANLLRESGRCLLYYVFRSDKHATEPATNPHSRGAADLVVETEPRIHLEGDYWMEVGTKGRILTTGHSAKRYATFSAAKAGTYS